MYVWPSHKVTFIRDHVFDSISVKKGWGFKLEMLSLIYYVFLQVNRKAQQHASWTLHGNSP